MAYFYIALVEEAWETMNEAHHFQNKLIQSEARGEKIEITLLH
ncbi:hypothetical protein CON64_21455 [Bacillus pseudomycoides]|nr:hypothetical protein CON64_21455 [Bacillus pseudomycoides]